MGFLGQRSKIKMSIKIEDSYFGIRFVLKCFSESLIMSISNVMAAPNHNRESPLGDELFNPFGQGCLAAFQIRLRTDHIAKINCFFGGVVVGKHFKTLESTLAHAQLLNKGLLGDLKLGYVGSAMEKVIPRLMNGFRETHQKVMFSLKEMDNQDQIKSLFSNEIDVGFVRMERVPKGLKATTILQEPFCLVVPKNHPINNKNFKDISQLKDASFILFDPKYSPSYYEKVMQIFDDSGFTPIVTHNTIHSGSIYKLVAHHFGVSIVPKSLKSDHLKEVRFIELHDIPQQTALSAVWNENNRNPVLDDFLVQVQSFKSVH